MQLRRGNEGNVGISSDVSRSIKLVIVLRSCGLLRAVFERVLLTSVDGKAYFIASGCCMIRVWVREGCCKYV